MQSGLPYQESKVTCLICRTGETAPGVVTVPLQRGETTVILNGVPAEVCGNCGEYYLSEDITRRALERAEAAVAGGAEVEILRFAA